MYSPKKELTAPSSYEFPYEPYEIQKELMKSLYETIQRKEIGIFESPTGTGKSLTLTCAALKWLVDHDELVRSEIDENIKELKEDIAKLEKSSDWIEAQYNVRHKKQELRLLEGIRSDMKTHDEKLEKMKKSEENRKILRNVELRRKYVGKENVRKDKETKTEQDEVDEDDKFLVEEQDKDESDEEEEKVERTNKDVKIFFCSRTHSQLSQIVQEIKKTAFGKFIRCVSLASRKNLCVNPNVKRLNSLALINEKCLDMQKAKSKTTSKDENGQVKKRSKLRKENCKCPYKNQMNVGILRDVSVSEILDIEDLVRAGETVKACPYYAGRHAVDDAQIVLLPYQMLLHRKTREQTGICLKDSIVIIDEAHNLLDSVSTIYSTEITNELLSSAHEQLVGYKQKYLNRLHSRTLIKLGQLIFISKQLKHITSSNFIENGSYKSMRTYELMEAAHFGNMKLFELIEYCEKSHLAEKVHGLAKSEANKPSQIEESDPLQVLDGPKSLMESIKAKLVNKTKPKKVVVVTKVVTEEKSEEKKIPSAVRSFLAFLESLTECAESGKVILYNTDGVTGVKFTLMSPDKHFEDILTGCRSVIIAGGTMQPVDDLKNQLLRKHLERVKLYVYGHVVPADAVQAFTLSKGPTHKEFRFTSALRSNPLMISELGRTLENICSIVPGGVVVFFGSYAYLDEVYDYFNKNEHLNNIQKKKFIYREPRSTDPGSVDKLLASYAISVRNTERDGAILFSVVGGKLSEGLNFADDLGRCVVVVGLPFPNKTSPVLQEQIKYLNSTFGENAGNNYYENICMKAVNQSIGRSIRHINDYACVVLLDERFTQDRIRSKLPGWILPYVRDPKAYGVMHGSIAKFFRSKKKE